MKDSCTQIANFSGLIAQVAESFDDVAYYASVCGMEVPKMEAKMATDWVPTPDLRSTLTYRVGPALQALRMARGWTQRQLVDRASSLLGRRIAQAYLSKVENSGKVITLDRLGLFLDSLGASMGDLAEAMAKIDAISKLDQVERTEALRDQTAPEGCMLKK